MKVKVKTICLEKTICLKPICLKIMGTLGFRGAAFNHLFKKTICLEKPFVFVSGLYREEGTQNVDGQLGFQICSHGGRPQEQLPTGGKDVAMRAAR